MGKTRRGVAADGDVERAGAGLAAQDRRRGAVSGESVDPSQKARILAEGISEAMNCTAFGLIVALIALIGFAVLNGKTQQIEDDINEASVQVLNLVVTNRQKVNLSAVAA